MDIIKAFKNNEVGINITIKGTNEEPLFRASDIGIVLDIKNIHQNIQDFDNTEKGICKTYTLGGDQDIIYLTEKGLYKTLFRSKKPIAKKFTDWVCEVIKEIRINGVYNLEQQLKMKDQEIKTVKDYNEANLILNFKNKQVVYTIQVEEKIVKFGHTKDIETRLKEHRLLFGPAIKLIFIFDTVYNREFESMIKRDNVIKTKIVKKVYKNEKEQIELIHLDETFSMSDLNRRLELLKDSVNGDLVNNLIKENEELKKENELLKITTNIDTSKELLISQLRAELAEYKAKVLAIENRSMQTTIDIEKVNFIREHSAPRKDQFIYQVYDPKNLQLVKTFDTIDELARETKLFKDAIKQSVGRAVQLNTVYKGYRFWRLQRSDEIKEYKIPDTIEVDRTQKNEQIVKMSQDNTEILGIYGCSEDAAKQNIKQNASEYDIKRMKKSITNNLSESGLSYGFHWYRLSEAPQDILDAYLKTHILPEVQIHKNNKKVIKSDCSLNHIAEFMSISSAAKEAGVSDTTLHKHIKNGTILNNHFYSIK